MRRVKYKAIVMYMNDHMGSKRIGKELGVLYSIINRWINHYNEEDLKD
jgi:transposase